VNPSLRSSVLGHALGALLAAGCGSGASQMTVTSEFTEAHGTVLEDGVDFVDDPTVLEGRWQEDWMRDLDRRVSISDGIFVIQIRTIRTDVDLERQETFRLIGEIGATLYGDTPDSDELELTVEQGSGGFDTVEGNEQRLMRERMLAFVKWYESESGNVLAHWHLSPATDGVIARVEYLIQGRRDGAGRR
jgi:hypothetical protein